MQGEEEKSGPPAHPLLTGSLQKVDPAQVSSERARRRKSEPPAHPTTHRFVAKVGPACKQRKARKKKVGRPPTPLIRTMT